VGLLLLLLLVAAAPGVACRRQCLGTYHRCHGQVFGARRVELGVRQQVALPHILDDAEPGLAGEVDYIIPWPAELQYANPHEPALGRAHAPRGHPFSGAAQRPRGLQHGLDLRPQRKRSTRPGFRSSSTLPSSLLQAEASGQPD
jgi:hypothetical protein